MRIRAACDACPFGACCDSSALDRPATIGKNRGPRTTRPPVRLKSDCRSGRAPRRQHLVEGGEFERFRHARPAVEARKLRTLSSTSWPVVKITRSA